MTKEIFCVGPLRSDTVRSVSILMTSYIVIYVLNYLQSIILCETGEVG